MLFRRMCACVTTDISGNSHTHNTHIGTHTPAFIAHTHRLLLSTRRLVSRPTQPSKRVRAQGRRKTRYELVNLYSGNGIYNTSITFRSVLSFICIVLHYRHPEIVRTSTWSRKGAKRRREIERNYEKNKPFVRAE